MSILSRLCKPNVKKLGTRKNIKRLIKAIDHKDEGVRQEAIVVLSEIGDPAFVKPFVTNLQYLEINYKRELQRMTQSSSNMQFILHQAKELREKHKQDRAKSLWALKVIGNSNNIKPFRKEMRKVMRERKREEPQWQSIKRTRGEWNRVEERRNRPIWALKNIGKPAVLQIIETAKNKEECNSVRCWMIMILAFRKEAIAVDPIIQIALDESEVLKIREEAVDCFKWFDKDPRIIEPLRNLIKVENGSIQKKAEDILKRI